MSAAAAEAPPVEVVEVVAAELSVRPGCWTASPERQHGLPGARQHSSSCSCNPCCVCAALLLQEKAKLKEAKKAAKAERVRPPPGLLSSWLRAAAAGGDEGSPAPRTRCNRRCKPPAVAAARRQAGGLHAARPGGPAGAAVWRLCHGAEHGADGAQVDEGCRAHAGAGRPEGASSRAAVVQLWYSCRAAAAMHARSTQAAVTSLAGVLAKVALARPVCTGSCCCKRCASLLCHAMCRCWCAGGCTLCAARASLLSS